MQGCLPSTFELSERTCSQCSTACLNKLALRTHFQMDVSGRNFLSLVESREQMLSSCLKQSSSTCVPSASLLNLYCLWQHVQPRAMGSLVPCRCAQLGCLSFLLVVTCNCQASDRRMKH